MPVRVDKTGAFEIEYSFSPYLGLNVQAPENVIPDNSTPSSNNFMWRNGELRSRPYCVLEFPAPDPINPPLGNFSFLDSNEVYHTVCWTSRGLWQLSGNNRPPNQQPWAFLGGPTFTLQNPVSYRTFANVLYYVNGSPFLASWDGIAQTPVASVATISMANAPTVGGSLPGAPTMVGPLSIGGYYLTELNNQLILVNVVVLDEGTGIVYEYPNMVWWSANGLPSVWDPTVNTSAGFNPFLDVPDIFTGVATIGIAMFLQRKNGITQGTPTGSSVAPFDFEHLWSSDHGIGNIYQWSMASYGSSGFFVSTENIYQMSVNSFQPIGGASRDAIYADLAQASGNPVASFTAQLGLGYIYQRYTISIPLTIFTRHYVYSAEDNNWSAWDTPDLLITGKEEVCFTGQFPSYSVPGVYPALVSPTGTGNTGGSGGSGGGGGNSGPPINGGGGGGRPVV